MSNTHGQELLTPRKLNRALLQRQSLLERSELAPVDVLRHLVGMQSQAPQAPYVGLWTRLSAFDPTELSRLMVDREVVRIALMRGTVHLVTADDCLTLRPLVQPILERDLERNTTFAPLLSGIDFAALASEGRALLEEQPLTAVALGKALQAHWPDRDPGALAHAIRGMLPLVQVPPRGLWRGVGQATATTAESWLGRPLDSRPSLDTMITRYLAAFGPATVADIQAWSGLPGVRAVLETMRPRLRTFRDERGRELFDVFDGEFADPDTPAPVRFLPEFDNLLLSHDDRNRVVPEAHRQTVLSSLGQPMFLIDGFVAGRWKLRRERKSAALTIAPFDRVSARDRAALAHEGLQLLDFVAGDREYGGIEWPESGA